MQNNYKKLTSILPLLILFIPLPIFYFSYFLFFPRPYNEIGIEGLYLFLVLPFFYVYEVSIYSICRNLQKKFSHLQLASLIAGISITLIIILGVFNQLDIVISVLMNPFSLLLLLIVLLAFSKL